VAGGPQRDPLKLVHAYAFKHADRQDLFQEIAIRVWRSMDAFRGDSTVLRWKYLDGLILADCPPRFVEVSFPVRL